MTVTPILTPHMPVLLFALLLVKNLTLQNVGAVATTWKGRACVQLLENGEGAGKPRVDADDQLRRNHSTQYISFPDWPWQRLREQSPGAYESYTDLETGAWTRIKIVVRDSHASLYVNGASQPALIINDLKLGNSEGSIALWIDHGTEGYFSNLRVSPLRE